MVLFSMSCNTYILLKTYTALKSNVQSKLIIWYYFKSIVHIFHCLHVSYQKKVVRRKSRTTKIEQSSNITQMVLKNVKNILYNQF